MIHSIAKIERWVRVSSHDLVVGGKRPLSNGYKRSLLRLVASTIIDIGNFGGADAAETAETVLDHRPELRGKWDQAYIERLAKQILHAEVKSLSKVYSTLFAALNGEHFGGTLPPYEVRVVFDVHSFVGLPIGDSTIKEVVRRDDVRCIFLRFTEEAYMLDVLLCEMRKADSELTSYQ